MIKISGGFFEYDNNHMYDWADQIGKKNPINKKFSKLIRDVAGLLHEFDYAECGDTGREDFEKEFDKFLKKWSVK